MLEAGNQVLPLVIGTDSRWVRRRRLAMRRSLLLGRGVGGPVVAEESRRLLRLLSHLLLLTLEH